MLRVHLLLQPVFRSLQWQLATAACGPMKQKTKGELGVMTACSVAAYECRSRVHHVAEGWQADGAEQ